MSQTADEVLDDLRKFVAGRGREDNFLYSKYYSPSSYISSVDFSPWIGRQLIKKDIFALAVFFAYNSVNSSYGVSLNSTLKNNEEVEMTDEEEISFSFESEIHRHKNRIERILKFPFEEYFIGDINSAKFDLIVSWLLGYSYLELSKVLTAYNLELINVSLYIKKYNDIKKTGFLTPTKLQNNIKLDGFRKELKKLPLATRLHLFDILSYSDPSKSTKNTKPKLISNMTRYETRAVGIDEKESAEILCQSKLIVSFADGSGYIAPEFIETLSIVAEYAKNMSPAYREWHSDVSDQISDFDSVLSDILDDQDKE